MADYDRRGGGGGYNNYRKRRFRDDDNNGDYRAAQRRRHDIPAAVRIRRQLLSLAESPLRRWHEDAVSLGRLVAENDGSGPEAEQGQDKPQQSNPHRQQQQHARETFVSLVCQIVCEQPLKTPFVAGVLLVVNALRPAIVKDVLKQVAAATEAAIADGRWRDVKLQLRLLACLQSCIAGEGIFPVLDTLFDRAVVLQTASSDDVIGTELVKIILLTIPYVMAAAGGRASDNEASNGHENGVENGHASTHKWHQRAAELMEKTDIIASEPHALQKLMEPYLPKEEGLEDIDGDDEYAADIPQAESALALLQKQLQTEAASGWPLACLPRPWKMPLEDVELQGRMDEADTHELPAIAVPETVAAGERPLFPEVYFSVYGAAKDNISSQSVPPVTNVAASLIRDSLLDTINVMHFNRNVTARFLIDVDSYFADNTFVKRATPFDKLGEVAAAGAATTWKPEDVAVDAVFSQLMQLAAPEHKLVYYHSVLAETCKLAPAAIAPSLGRAIRYLYRHSGRMDLELGGRFVDWFAHHLSNFGFTWKWAEWVDDVALPDTHPRKAFIRGALDKEIRLSFAQRIKNTVPEPYQRLISADTERDAPVFKYEEGAANAEEGKEVPFAAEGRELAALLRRKAPDEEVQAVIERIHELALDSGRGDPLVASTDVFATAVLAVGSKSLSHVLACIERTKDRLLDAGAASEAARRQILVAVMAFWHAHPGVAVSITEKLLNYAILSPETVVQWALEEDTEGPWGREKKSDGDVEMQEDKDESIVEAPRLTRTHVIELVFNTVAKVTRRVHQVIASKQAATAAVTAAQTTLDAALERQKNPPPAPVSSSAKAANESSNNMDVDDGDSGDAAAAAAAAAATAAAEVEAEAAAQVEAAEAALATATADVAAARSAETAEIQAMRDLFRQVSNALQPWAARTDDGHIRAWARRWQRVVERRQAIEEALLAEAGSKA